MGSHYSLVDPSASTILYPGFKSQAHHLSFPYVNLKWYCGVKRTKINNSGPGLAHFLKKSVST